LPGVSRVSVEPVLPVDVIGIYVLVPAVIFVIVAPNGIIGLFRFCGRAKQVSAAT
jgi:hypothetical protein